MAELSPAAQAVLDSFTAAACHNQYRLHEGIAAALRAAADQVAPLRTKTPLGSTINPSTEACCIHAALYSIAAELDS